MPYVGQDRRKLLVDLGDDHWDEVRVNTRAIETPGDLNYVISTLLDHYTSDRGVCYQTCNDVVGVLACATREYQRRIVDPLEARKVVENGEVFLLST